MGVAGLCLWRSLTDKGKHHTEAMVFGLILLYYLFDWYTLSFGPVPPGFALGHIIWLSLSAAVFDRRSFLLAYSAVFLLAGFVPGANGAIYNNHLVMFGAFAAAGLALVNLERRRRHQQRLRNLQAASFHQTRLAGLGEMAAAVSHQTMSPLRVISDQVILSTMELNREIPDKGVLLTSMSTIEEKSADIRFTIKTLLEFADPAHDEQEMVAVSLHDLERSCLTLCQERFAVHGITLQSFFPKSPMIIHCSRTSLMQALVALLNNAAEAVRNSRRKHVVFRAEMTDDGYLFTVEDTGQGIAPEIRDSLVLPFFTTKPAGEGAGLGLAVAEGVARYHGGRLWYSPTDSDTTCFYLSISQNQVPGRATAPQSA